jgi:hypothetical protein
MQHQIYFCKIHIKHMQHKSKTHETYSCNMCLSTCCHPMKAYWLGARCHNVEVALGPWTLAVRSVSPGAGGTRRKRRTSWGTRDGWGAQDPRCRHTRHGGRRVRPVRPDGRSTEGIILVDKLMFPRSSLPPCSCRMIMICSSYSLTVIPKSKTVLHKSWCLIDFGTIPLACCLTALPQHIYWKNELTQDSKSKSIYQAHIYWFKFNRIFGFVLSKKAAAGCCTLDRNAN